MTTLGTPGGVYKVGYSEPSWLGRLLEDSVRLPRRPPSLRAVLTPTRLVAAATSLARVPVVLAVQRVALALGQPQRIRDWLERAVLSGGTAAATSYGDCCGIAGALYTPTRHTSVSAS